MNIDNLQIENHGIISIITKDTLEVALSTSSRSQLK